MIKPKHLPSTLMTNPCQILEGDLDLPAHQEAIRFLTATYALDPMGNGGPLPVEVLDRLIPGLRGHPSALIFLAYLQDRPIGIATCFRGFSTFAARPLINISDFAILPGFRGRGFGHQLLVAVERKSIAFGCCRITLEVQKSNMRARRVYEESVFSQAIYGPEMGGSLYFWKPLRFPKAGRGFPDTDSEALDTHRW